MDKNTNVNKIIRKLCKEVFPGDVFQQGSSRVYLDDNGYYLTMAEFQPCTLGKGAMLNVGVSWLFVKMEYLPFSYAYDNQVRAGQRFIEYVDDAQFETDIREYVELAGDYILRYREFRDIGYTKEYMLKTLDDDGWHPYEKAMFCFLMNDEENGRRFYQKFIDEPYFRSKVIGKHHLEGVVEKYRYPTEAAIMNREYVLDMIRQKRELLHSKSSMKKMKRFEAYE